MCWSPAGFVSEGERLNFNPNPENTLSLWDGRIFACISASFTSGALRTLRT